METTDRPLTVAERAFETAQLHPACTLEYRRLKKQKLFQAIFKNKPGTPPFLYKAKGKTLDEALAKATNLFISVARQAAAVKQAAEEAVAEAAAAETTETEVASAGAAE